MSFPTRHSHPNRMLPICSLAFDISVVSLFNLYLSICCIIASMIPLVPGGSGFVSDHDTSGFGYADP